jgi:hypothetical protein
MVVAAWFFRVFAPLRLCAFAFKFNILLKSAQQV